MNPATKFFLVGAAFVLSVGAQAVAQTTQANGQAAAQVNVQADKTQAQASDGASASGQTSSGQLGQANAGLASGTAFNATLNASIDSKKCKAGDAVAAHTTENVKADGKTVLPKGSKLIGHVTQATARAKGDSESALAIMFDRAIQKNGEEVPLNVAIQAMAGAQTAASATDADMDTMGSAAGSGMTGGRGTAGGLTSAAGGAVGSVTNTAAGAGDAALHSTVSSTTDVASASRGAVGGLSAAGQLTSNSRGVFNINGLTLNAAAANGTQGSVITSAGKNVHLDSGTRLLMVTETTASATPNR